MIRRRGTRFRLYTHDGSRPLGPWTTYAKALAQERAIQVRKHVRSNPTPESVRRSVVKTGPRNGSDVIVVGFAGVGEVLFEQIGVEYPLLYKVTITYVDGQKDSYPMKLGQPITDRSLRHMGIRGWSLFEPAMKAAFGVRENPEGPRRQFSVYPSYSNGNTNEVLLVDVDDAYSSNDAPNKSDKRVAPAWRLTLHANGQFEIGHVLAYPNTRNKKAYWLSVGTLWWMKNKLGFNAWSYFMTNHNNGPLDIDEQAKRDIGLCEYLLMREALPLLFERWRQERWPRSRRR